MDVPLKVYDITNVCMVQCLCLSNSSVLSSLCVIVRVGTMWRRRLRISSRRAVGPLPIRRCHYFVCQKMVFLFNPMLHARRCSFRQVQPCPSPLCLSSLRYQGVDVAMLSIRHIKVSLSDTRTTCFLTLTAAHNLLHFPSYCWNAAGWILGGSLCQRSSILFPPTSL